MKKDKKYRKPRVYVVAKTATLLKGAFGPKHDYLSINTRIE